MSQVFAITAASNNVRLDSKGNGELSFTVSNTSDRPLRARFELKAGDPAQQPWLSLAGEEERSFDVQGTHQVVVRIAAPPGSPAGSYSFRLDVISTDNPDEDFAEGQAVTFDVKASEPLKSGFPWWIAAVAAAVVLVVGAGAWFFFSREAPKEPEPSPPAVVSKTLPLEFAADWSDHSEEYAPAVVRVEDKVCFVEGLVKVTGANITQRKHIATLPEECHPQRRLVFNLNNHANTARVDVMEDGRITWVAGGSGHRWISLTGISFAQGEAQPLGLGRGWSNYGHEYTGATVRKVDSLCIVEGLVRTSNRPPPPQPPLGILMMRFQPHIVTLPEDCRPAQRHVFNLNTHDATIRVDVLPDGRVVWAAGGANHNWISLNGIVVDLGAGEQIQYGPRWSDYGNDGNDYAGGKVYRHGNVCVVEGLLKTGEAAVTAQRHIATLPAECRPSKRLIFNVNNNAKTARVDLMADGRILWVAGGADHRWISLSGIMLSVPKAGGGS